jgi:hypothetical protein
MKTFLITRSTLLALAGCVCFATNPAQAAERALPSDVLERAIYAEETKGDLNGAITLYKQLVSDAKATEKLAAQAQFRLGQCLLKLKRPADANAAFEKLIRDYPNEKELIAKAKAQLPGAMTLGPVPWVDGEVLHFVMKLPTGLDLGAMIYRADTGQAGDRNVWRVGARIFAGGMMQSFSRVEVDADDFRPISSRWKHSLIGDATVIYSPNSAQTTVVGAAEPKVAAFDTPTYDNEEAVHLMRRLPLEVGYKTTVPILSGLGGGALFPVGLEVKSIDKFKVPAGEFECYRVDLSLNQTFWFTTDAHHYLTKFEAGGMIAELVKIEQRVPGKPVQLHDDATGVTLTVPEYWFIHKRDKQDNSDNDAATEFYVMDPEADITMALLKLYPTGKVKEGKSSPRVWAEARLADLAKELKDLKVRAESWKILSISGRPAIGFVADYNDGKKAAVLLGAYALGPEQCEEFVMAMKAADLATAKPAFDSIVSTYRSK